MELQPTGRRGRRSKMEMLGDVLATVSRGVRRPTRIMQVANLTWADFLGLTEALTRNGLLVREEGTRQYMLTAKGRSVLDHYASLKEGLLQAESDVRSRLGVAKALTHPVLAGRNKSVASALKARLLASGSRAVASDVKGRSGTTHSLDLVVRGRDGSRNGYAVLGNVSESQIFGLFVRQLDTGMGIRVVYTGKVSQEARALADRYSIRMEKWLDEKETTVTEDKGLDLLGFQGRKVLVEVNPVLRYEISVKKIVSEFAEAGQDVNVFTWKGSPIYEAVFGIGGIRLFTMTSAASYTKQVDNTNEFLVPQADQAVLLEEMRKVMDSHRKPNAMFLLDSASDLLVLLGVEHTYKFLRTMTELLSESNATTFSILKKQSHDEKTDNLIKGIFTDHLLYDRSGLSVVR